MPIDVLTGQPGNGKTAIAIERMMKDAAAAERRVFAAGFDGLKADELGVTVLEDPRRWNDVNDLGEHLVPDGSVIYVDESWKWFGHLQDATRGPTPAHVLALAEHRHRGLDFVWTTQMPNQIYPFVRGLIGTHTHVLRRYGTHFVETFTWGELNEDVKSVSKRENAERSVRTLPKESFDKYKSATIHTIKRRLPFKMLMVPVGILGGGLALWFAVQSLKPDAVADRINGQEASAAEAAPPSTTATRPKTYTTAEEYAVLMTPRIPEMPHTAPAFDGRAIASDPQLYCVAGGRGEDGDGRQRAESCTCLTEQGTPYTIGPATCKRLARDGQPYNPFKAPRDESRDRPGRSDDRGDGVPPSAMAASAAAPSRGSTGFGEMAAYGGHGLAGDSAPR